MEDTRIAYRRSRPSPRQWFFECFREHPVQTTRAMIVPWRDRGDGEGVYTLTNRTFMNGSAHVLFQVRVFRACRCGLRMSLPRRVLPGDLVEVRREPSRCAGCTHDRWWLRWFTGDGTELVWPFVW